MNNELCGMTGAEFPPFALSQCRDVVAAVSRAGGFGVLGGSSFTPESLKVELEWIDEHVDGKPYGIDILISEKQPISRAMTIEELAARIPDPHIGFPIGLLGKSGITLEREMATPERQPRLSATCTR